MATPTASIRTLGCKLNQYESEQMREQLESLGYRMVEYDHGADLCIVNSCTVTSRTDREARRLARGAKRLNPAAFVVMAGCYVEVAVEELSSVKEIDLLLSNHDKLRLSEFVPTAAKHPLPSSPASTPALISSFSGHTRAFVKVQEGCDATCTYCIIPRARGGSRSVPVQRVLEQCRVLADAGHPEVALIGTHLGRYGQDLDEDVDLAALVRMIAELPIRRIRLSSIEPREVTTDLLGMIRDGGRALERCSAPTVAGKLCRHLHIPLQSGCDTVLARMNRPYDAAFYRDLVLAVRQASPDTCIGADVIVGFPGETDAEFETTRRFIEDLPLTYLHVFTYSERRGTPAADMPDQVDYEVRKSRNHILRAISEDKRERFAQSMVGKRLEVVVQQPAGEDRVMAISDNYLEVCVAGIAARSGELSCVTIQSAKGAVLQGCAMQ
jgi:threonylcarbamoyladenosine tRNA methylthiotransferase MtaB